MKMPSSGLVNVDILNENPAHLAHFVHPGSPHHCTIPCRGSGPLFFGWCGNGGGHWTMGKTTIGRDFWTHPWPKWERWRVRTSVSHSEKRILMTQIMSQKNQGQGQTRIQKTEMKPHPTSPDVSVTFQPMTSIHINSPRKIGLFFFPPRFSFHHNSTEINMTTYIYR